MNFNIKDIHLTKNISSLKHGDVFYYENSGTIWMKLIREYKLHEDYYATDCVNAVSLDDGTLAFFNDTDVIIPLNNVKVVNDEN